MDDNRECKMRKKEKNIFEKKVSGKKQPSSDALSSGDIPKQSSKETKVPYVSLPTPLPPGKKIHRRQVVPPVPEDREVPDDNPSPPVDPD